MKSSLLLQRYQLATKQPLARRWGQGQGLVAHALEMPLRALRKAYFGARAAAQPKDFESLKTSAVRVHAELRHGIAPHAKNFFAKGRRNVHEPRVVAHHKLGLAHQRSRLMQRKLPAGVEDRVWE